MRGIFKAALIAVALSAVFAAPVAAGPFEDGVAAYARGDYAPLFRLLRPFAEQGDATAQYSLGVMYANGEGVPQDYRCARRVLADRHGSEPEKARKSHHKTAATACNGLIHAAKPHPTRPITGNRLGSAPRRKRKPSTASISGHQNAVPVRLLQQLQPLAE